MPTRPASPPPGGHDMATTSLEADVLCTAEQPGMMLAPHPASSMPGPEGWRGLHGANGNTHRHPRANSETGLAAW